MLAYTDNDLQPFHDYEPLHTHQKCDHCRRMQRGHSFKLSSCAGCNINMYCSKECQVADWPSHKVICKAYKEERLSLAETTGIPSAAPDFYAWMKYYDTPLKNCALAAMDIRERPHCERIAFLCVSIRHSGDTSVPVAQRFIVESVGREAFADFAWTAPAEHYEQACQMGKIEMGEDFYGVVRYGLTVKFGPQHAPSGITFKWKHFSINKGAARASSTRADWWNLFREYVAASAKVHFCCGKVEGMEDVCCCGEWTHDVQKTNAFRSVAQSD